MGDRAIVVFKDGDKCSPAAYLHWGGGSIPGFLHKTWKLMEGRRKDMSYSFARFVGVCHENDPDSNTSLGAWSLPADFLFKTADELRDYSHGDAGLFIVDVNTPGWDTKVYGGYGFDMRDDIRHTNARMVEGGIFDIETETEIAFPD